MKMHAVATLLGTPVKTILFNTTVQPEIILYLYEVYNVQVLVKLLEICKFNYMFLLTSMRWTGY